MPARTARVAVAGASAAHQFTSVAMGAASRGGGEGAGAGASTRGFLQEGVVAVARVEHSHCAGAAMAATRACRSAGGASQSPSTRQQVVGTPHSARVDAVQVDRFGQAQEGGRLQRST
jgi:hypothetical protein